ncbi:MAG: TetR/AcrR family transcriptional regulator [Proteobacteria bacterium]|nr:TetR/AcrR family transcriptional regulator [Pseudomonadota bacterium]
MATRAETKAKTRRALLRAGRRLVVEQGLDSPSLDLICKTAGFTRGAFYVHFEDRDDFLASVMESILADYTASIVQTADPAGDLERSIRRFVTSLDDLGKDAPHLSLLLDGCTRSDRVRDRFIAGVRASIVLLAGVGSSAAAAGELRDDVPVHAISELLVATVFGVLATRQLGVPFDLTAAAEALITLLRPMET